MTTDTTPKRRPIGTVRISTVALIGIVAAVAVPVTAFSVVSSGALDQRQESRDIRQDGPVDRVVLKGTNGSIHVLGDSTQSGVHGKGTVQYHDGDKPELQQSYGAGTLILSFSCPKHGCGGVEWDISVPPDVAVDAETSNAGITIDDVTGDVTAKSSNGSISAHHLGTGAARLTTSNARIGAQFDGATPSIYAKTSNGDVDIQTDGKTAYFDDVSTSNGSTDKSNLQDRMSANSLTVITSNADVKVS